MFVELTWKLVNSARYLHCSCQPPDKMSRDQQRTADMSPTYESEEKKYAGEEKVVMEEKVTREEIKDGSSVTISTTSTTTTVKEPTKELKSEVIEESITKAPIVPEEPKVEHPIPETRVVAEEVIPKVEKDKPFPEDFDEKTFEKKEAIEKIEPVKEKAKEEPHTTETTVTEVVSGPDGAPVTITSTERTTYSTGEDGTVQEHIVVQKQTSKVVDGLETKEDKSTLLQKLGEELGRLDEQLEEKFKEKRKADEPKGKLVVCTPWGLV